VPGRVKTRLAASVGDDAACRLYRAFLRDLCIQLARPTGWHIAWWVDGNPGALRTEMAPLWKEEWAARCQPDGGLGHRLRSCFEHAFEEYGGPVAVIGTDCPQLGTDHLTGLFAPLRTGSDAALLPAEDGGYAGLALTRPAPEVFRDIPWSTAQVADQTLARLRRVGCRVTVLPAVFDVDTLEELRRLDQLLRSRPELAPHTSTALLEMKLPEGG
jgi:hypothetical protein